MAVFGMLTGRGAGYSLSGTLAIDTPFGPMALPIDKAGDTIFRRWAGSVVPGHGPDAFTRCWHDA